MAISLPVENLLPQNVGPIINYLHNATEISRWRTPGCSWPQPAGENAVRYGRSSWLSAIQNPICTGQYTWAPSIARCATNHKTFCSEWGANTRPFGMPGNSLPVRPLRVSLENLTNNYYIIVSRFVPCHLVLYYIILLFIYKMLSTSVNHFQLNVYYFLLNLSVVLVGIDPSVRA